MPKIYAKNSKSILIMYLIKILLSSVVAIIFFSVISSLILLKADIDLKYIDYIAVVICALSSSIISLVSISGFKNNYLMLSIISVLPLMLYTIINFCINGTNYIVIIVKLASIIVASFISAIIMSKKKIR